MGMLLGCINSDGGSGAARRLNSCGAQAQALADASDGAVKMLDLKPKRQLQVTTLARVELTVHFVTVM